MLEVTHLSLPRPPHIAHNRYPFEASFSNLELINLNFMNEQEIHLV